MTKIASTRTKPRTRATSRPGDEQASSNPGPEMPKKTKPNEPDASKPARLRESGIDSLGRETYINLYLLSRRFTDEIDRICRTEKIAMSHYAFLWFLTRRHSPEGVPMGAIVDGHLNRASDATRLADRLTDLGYIERLASKNDRRVVLVRLTETGRDVFVRLTKQIRDLHREQWKALDESGLADLNRTLALVLWGDASASDRHPLVAATANDEQPNEEPAGSKPARERP
jgi:DNA-binding MarR family transcriptional regulator